MLRKMMVTGLMAATLLSGGAPAHAQSNAEQRGDRGGERAGRMDGGMARGEQMGQPRGEGPSQRWQRRGAERSSPPLTQARPDVRDNPQWQDGQPRPGNRTQRDWRQDRQQDRNGGPNGQWSGRDDRRPNWQQGQRDDRQADREWQADRQADREWQADRQADRRWNANRGWTGNGAAGANWNGGRRYDERTRWTGQRRWDNGWRSDRRYDWNSYRNRYGDRYRIGRYAAPRGWDYGYRRFSVGIFLNNMLYANSYWLDDPYSYRLPPTYGSLRWIRYYDDALLVDVRDGYVVDVINNFFW